ncbi:MAG: hypothetical protein AAF441_25890 [Pseudomonadota bacterium]
MPTQVRSSSYLKLSTCAGALVLGAALFAGPYLTDGSGEAQAFVSPVQSFTDDEARVVEGRKRKKKRRKKRPRPTRRSFGGGSGGAGFEGGGGSYHTNPDGTDPERFAAP